VAIYSAFHSSSEEYILLRIDFIFSGIFIRLFYYKLVEMGGIEPPSKKGRHMNLQSLVYFLHSVIDLKNKQNNQKPKPN